MEKFNPDLETRVWQRITAAPEPGTGDIRPLLLMAQESAAVYRHLTGRLTGKQRERMRTLYRTARHSLECLKGIQRMGGNSAGNPQPQPVPKEPVRRLLEKSFHRSRQLMTEYTARTLDPEFGVVLQQLADRERENCRVLAELIGGLDR